MRGALHQMPAKAGPQGAGGAGRAEGASGEAVRSAVSDEAPCPRHQPESTGQGLLVQVLAADNMRRAWKRVKANRGAAGVDGWT